MVWVFLDKLFIGTTEVQRQNQDNLLGLTPQWLLPTWLSQGQTASHNYGSSGDSLCG